MRALKLAIIAAAALFATPALAAPTIGGCGTTAIAKADANNPTKLQAQADCFGEGEALAQKAKEARLDRIKVITPSAPTGAVTAAMAAGLIFQDYDYGGGNHIPGTAAPDVVGAFRFICTAGPLNYDDAIVYPGQIGGSPHLHQNLGNTLINGKSTTESLTLSGESTCSNIINRSAYWVPALITGDGKNVVQPDYISIYYKRRPASDPACFKMAVKGCVNLPVGLRVLSGYDMRRMGEAQPENATFTHRCITAGKPSIHRTLLAEAIADCGGSGQVMSSVHFPTCWNGQLDSPDHRKHLANPEWDNGNSGTPWPGPCPKTHPYLIPELNQSLAYTIEPSDGPVYFSSDRMAGMAPMPAGSTFHADYMPAWFKPVLDKWHANCIDKLLSCSDGALGDGTRLGRPPLTYKASPRLVPVPARPSA